MPLISVVMPVYNCNLYIREAIDSVLNQSFSDFEFIIINDGSTDGTQAIVEAAATTDSRIRLINRENRGLVASLNEGISLATGDLIARMDGDDVSLPDRFEKQVAFLDAHPDHVLVGGQTMLIDPKGRWLCMLNHTTDHCRLQLDLLKGLGAVFHPTMMYRKKSAIEVRGYSDKYLHAEDVDFLLRISETGKIANLDACVLLYRLHFSSVGMTRRREQVQAAYRAALAAAERRGLPPPELPNPHGLHRSRVDAYRRWGWWALNGGHVGTARYYAARALLSQPFNLKSLRLAVCALRGY